LVVDGRVDLWAKVSISTAPQERWEAQPFGKADCPQIHAARLSAAASTCDPLLGFSFTGIRWRACSVRFSVIKMVCHHYVSCV